MASLVAEANALWPCRFARQAALSVPSSACEPWRVTDNDVESALAQLARQLFPAVYAEDPPWATPTPVIDFISSYFYAELDQSRNRRFMDAAHRDEIIQTVLAPEEKGVFISASSGSGSRITTSLLGPGLVASAARRVVVEGRPTTLDALLETTSEELRRFRRLLAGEAQATLSVEGYAGLSLSPETSIETPWGMLLPARGRARRISPTEVETPVLLVREVSIRFDVGEPYVFEDDDAVARVPQFDETLAEASRRAETRLALAVTLALYGGANSPAATRLWQTTLVPGLGLGYGMRAGPTFGISSGSAAELSDDQAAEVRRWAALVEVHDHPSIQIAIRRIISAIQERAAPDDALIDAVIVAENLFGHGGTTEVGFRVSSALALLLERDPAKRRELKRELGKIYGLRSKVVHGGEITEKDGLSDGRDRAIETAVGALRELFEHRPELIPMRDRGIMLVLDQAA